MKASRISATVLIAFCASHTVRGTPTGGWTVPAPVGELNTQYDEGAPFLTYDGSTLYFSRMDVPGPYPGRLYSATRTTVDAPFGTPQELTGVNTPGGS